ncbi:MAG: sulfite exporter TauE/SafE family protein [Planctomycetota bacterium]|jgi:sulfite exporter TauE/SafE
MLTLLSTVLVASLLGSLHCAGMCGGVVAFLGGSSCSAGGRQDHRPHLAYHAGRFLSYLLLGVVAGSVGAALDLGGEALGLGRVAVLLAGALMVAYGVILLLRTRGLRLPIPVPKVLAAAYKRGSRQLDGRGPMARGLILGLLTAFLPCGWLYLFAGTAAATATPWGGALVMAAFWLGSVPILAVLGVGVQHLAAPLRRQLPSMSALLLIVVGLMALAGRFDPPAFAAGPAQGLEHIGEADPSCCDDGADG